MLDILTTSLPPYAYDLIGAFIILIFALRGFRRGIAKELSGILSLGASIVLAKPVGDVLIDAGFFGQVPLILQSMAAASVAGIIVYIVFRLGLYLIIRILHLDNKGEGLSRFLVQASGASLGGLFGTVVVFILCWFILLMGSLPVAPPTENVNAITVQNILLLPSRVISAHSEDFALSRLGSAAAKFNPIPKSVTASVDVISKISKDPTKIQKIVEQEIFQEIAAQESVQALIQNEEIRSLAEEGNIMELMNNPDVKNVLEDPTVQEALKNIDPEEMLKLLEGE